MSATWEGEARPICPSSPLLHGHSQVQTGSSLLPVSCGPTSGAGEGSERKGWDPLEKDHSFWGGGAFSQSQPSGAAKQAEPSRVRNWALFICPSDVSLSEKQEVDGFKSMSNPYLQNGN